MRALVTGVSEGIGGAICKQIARREDAAIGLCVRKSRPSVEVLAEDLRSDGCDVIVLEGDLRDPATPERYVAAAVARFGGLDAVVSNAGAVDPVALEDMPLQGWEDMFALTCRASWLLGKASFPYLKASQGALVAISSQSGVHPHRNTGAYSTAKAALIMLCKHMALEWGEHGIRVNCVSPGMIMTPMTQDIYNDDDIARQREAIVPLKRIGEPADVARIVDFLLAPTNRYITGENIVIDGGFTLSVIDRLPGLARSKTGPANA